MRPIVRLRVQLLIEQICTGLVIYPTLFAVNSGKYHSINGLAILLYNAYRLTLGIGDGARYLPSCAIAKSFSLLVHRDGSGFYI